ncbi:DUF4411 family protein [Gynurincola endophyticus]|uniref:DUF4411 family protein n=1 Tax=Gynurincola endophyticus TaxID=2479004 RepID=UPI000F8E13C1|nr:DUF4411 family protein [Gynurincola endophyticus]
MKKYLLDSNVLIQAHRMYYPFDVVPGFWQKLLFLSGKSSIISIDKVKNEICGNSTEDDLSKWCSTQLDSGFFVNTESCIDVYAQIAEWVNSHAVFSQSAKELFLSTELADPWLVAYAQKNNCTVVTHEISQPHRRNRIKIPEPCDRFGVRWITPIEMFRDLKETF